MGDSSALNNRRRRARRESGGSQLTQAAENYLLSIFMVREQGLPVTNINLVAQLKRTPESEGLGTSPPSVAGMIKRMSDDNLIGVSDSREIQLTSRGNTLAESIVRRHRLADADLVTLLEERLSVLDLEIVVVRADPNAHSDLLQLGPGLLPLLLLLALLIPVLAVIHNSADRWASVRGDLYKVQTGLVSLCLRDLRLNHPDLFPFGVDQENLRDANLLVDSRAFPDGRAAPISSSSKASINANILLL